MAALMVAGLVLRLWGHRVGLPYAYNVDEGAHFVPRAIGMFDHGYDPGYFVNPPGLTYVLHVAFWLRWGGDGVRHAYATDPGAVFAYARVIVAVLSTLSIGALAWAALRLFGDRRVALIAAGGLTIAFLPVHYGHFALNDAALLLPLCLSLAGTAGILRDGRRRDYVLAGAALGAAAAFKYTAGIVLVPLLLVAVWRREPRRLVLALAAALVGFLVLNPYALLSPDAFLDGLREQSRASADAGGKLGLADTNAGVYYAKTLLWGLGVLPLVAALAGAVGLARADRRRAALLVLAPVGFLVFMGLQQRYFSRWLLPVYPFLLLLGAWAVVQVRRTRWIVLAAVALAAQPLIFVLHNDVVLTRPDTRAALRGWMLAHLPPRTKIVFEPMAPGGFTDPWVVRAASHYRIDPQGRKTPVPDFQVEDYVPALRPDLLSSYTRGGFCWVVTASILEGRAAVTPEVAPYALDYYRALRAQGDVAFTVTPADPLPAFSFDDSYNWRPLAYDRPGPRVTVYRLHGDRCS